MQALYPACTIIPMLKKFIRFLKNNKTYYYPIILCFLFIFFIVQGIHGSSLGVYSKYFSDEKDTNLIANQPWDIRSDEWVIWTAQNAAQYEMGLPESNPLFGGDSDMAKRGEAPILNWTIIFSPQDIGYLFLPFINGFAFHWWLPLLLLLTASYYFCLHIFRRNVLLAVMFSLVFSFSPFILWWYQVRLLLPLAFGFLFVLCFSKMLEAHKKAVLNSKKIITYGITLSYLAIGIVIGLYIPFSIPIVLVCVAASLGLLLNSSDEKMTFVSLLKQNSSILKVLMVTVLLITLVGALFFVQHKEMIQLVENSVYPGERFANSGELEPWTLFDGILMPQLQNFPEGTTYYSNQSEVSSFLIFTPLMLVPSMYLLVVGYKKTRKINWLLLSLSLLMIILLLRSVVSFNIFLYDLLLLDRVPAARLKVGIGFCASILLLLTMKYFEETKSNVKTYRYLAAFITFVAGFTIYNLLFTKVNNEYPGFISSSDSIFYMTLFSALLPSLLFLNKKNLVMLLLLIMTALSSLKVVVLYKGLGELSRDSAIISAIDEASGTDRGRWITIDSIIYSNFPLVAGEFNVGGSQSYPELDFWKQIDDDEKYEFAYNRQTKVIFTEENTNGETFYLPANSVTQIQIDCNNQFYENNVDYALSIKPINLDCFKEINKIEYPKVHFYIYEITD